MRRALAFLRRHLLMTLGGLTLLAVVGGLWLFSAPIAQWSRSALGEYLPAVAISGCFVVVAAVVLIWIPRRQAALPHLTPQARFEVENEARRTLAQIIGGLAVIAGLVFAWENLRATQENLRITQETATTSHGLTREGQITERFSKAIDQLGAVNEKNGKQLEIRLGGIHALARIAKDSKDDHWPIMEVLTAYVREHAPRQDVQPAAETPSAKNKPEERKPEADIQAILTVLGRRTWLSHEGANQLNLARTDLRGADLRDAHLDRAIFRGAHLHYAILDNAHLEGADFRWAGLRVASFQGARLKGAKNLTVQQLSAVKSLYGAHLDPPLLEQIRQQYPHLLEEPK
jgi:hypothetical protein